MSISDYWYDLVDELSDRSKELKARLKLKRERLDPRDEAIFLRQLALMFSSGISLVDAIVALERTSVGPAQALARALADDLSRGHSLFQAFDRSRQRVGEIIPPLINAGESSGSLVQTMMQAADWSEMTAQIKARLVSAFIYPCFVLAVNMMLAALMLAFIFPTFVPLFPPDDLPVFTKFILGLSWLSTSKIFWLLATLGLGELWFFLSRPENKVKLYRALAVIPVIGAILRSAARARFCTVLALCSRTGLSITTAMALAAQASNDPELKELDTRLQRSIRDGESLSDFFIDNISAYGGLLSYAISQCEETGKTEMICGHLASIFKEEVNLKIRHFQALVEPLLMAAVSLTTGTLILAIYLPLGKFLQSLMN